MYVVGHSVQEQLQMVRFTHDIIMQYSLPDISCCVMMHFVQVQLYMGYGIILEFQHDES